MQREKNDIIKSHPHVKHTVNGVLLRSTRKSWGYSLRTFADMLECSPTYLSNVETGGTAFPASDDFASRLQNLIDYHERRK